MRFDGSFTGQSAKADGSNQLSFHFLPPDDDVI